MPVNDPINGIDLFGLIPPVDFLPRRREPPSPDDQKLADALKWLGEHHPELKPLGCFYWFVDLPPGKEGDALIPWIIRIDSSELNTPRDWVETVAHELMHQNQPYFTDLVDLAWYGETLHDDMELQSQRIGNEFQYGDPRGRR